MIRLALAVLLGLAVAACADPPDPRCTPATGAGTCLVDQPAPACVCGWPPWWER